MSSNNELNVLLVCRCKSTKDENMLNEIKGDKKFIYEEVNQLTKKDIDVEFSFIEEGGVFGYISALFDIRRKIKKEKSIDVIHAHYGLSGVVAVSQWEKPVVITFHGSDIHYILNNLMSSIVSHLSGWNIFVSKRIYDRILKKPEYKSSVISCGFNMDKFFPIKKGEAKKKAGLRPSVKYVLFSSSFENKIKNPELARKAVDKVDSTRLIELKGYSKNQVNILMNACEVVLITSYWESGPLVAKEAMACGTPVISVDVGDVNQVIKNSTNSYIVPYDERIIASRIEKVMKCDEKEKTEEMMKKFDVRKTAEKVKKIYKKLT